MLISEFPVIFVLKCYDAMMTNAWIKLLILFWSLEKGAVVREVVGQTDIVQNLTDLAPVMSLVEE